MIVHAPGTALVILVFRSITEVLLLQIAVNGVKTAKLGQSHSLVTITSIVVGVFAQGATPPLGVNVN